jgi:hypothetical protein
VEPQGLYILDGRDGDAKKAWFLRGFAPESVFFGILLLRMVADWVEFYKRFSHREAGFGPDWGGASGEERGPNIQ